MMRKLIIIAAAILVGALLASAETDYLSMPIIRDIQTGADTANQIVDLRVQGDGVFGDDVTASGDVTADAVYATTISATTVGMNNLAQTDGRNVWGTPRAVVTNVNFTLSSAYSYGRVGTTIALVTGTLAGAYAVGQEMRIINTTTGFVMFADSADQALAGDCTLGQYDFLWVVADATNHWTEVGRSDN